MAVVSWSEGPGKVVPWGDHPRRSRPLQIILPGDPGGSTGADYCPPCLPPLAVAVITYLFGYTMFFVAGHTLLDFLTLHVNTLRLYRSYVPEYPKGEIFRIIATGQWRTWWGDKGLVPSPFYTPLWTIGLVSALYLALCRQVRQHHVLILHLVWVFLVLGFISLRLVFPRYLLPLLPSLYLLLVVGVKYAIDELRFMFADTEAKIKTKIKNHFCESRTN